MLPYNIVDSMKNSAKLYTYGEVLELMAWASLSEDVREAYNIDSFKESYPDVFDHKIINADRIIKYA